MQGRQHLAAVADPERKAVVTREELAEHLSQAGVIKHGLRPALPCAQHVAIGKTAAGHHAPEIGQCHMAGQQIAHVDIHRGKAGTMEGRGHLDMPVDALLAQDGNPWPDAGSDQGCSDILIDFEGRATLDTQVVLVQQRIVFLLRTRRVIAQGLHLEGRLRPGALQVDARFGKLDAGVPGHRNLVGIVQCADHVTVVTQSGQVQRLEHGIRITVAYLDDRPEFLAEQRRHRVIAEFIQLQRHAAAPGEGHFTDTGKQAAV